MKPEDRALNMALSMINFLDYAVNTTIRTEWNNAHSAPERFASFGMVEDAEPFVPGINFFLVSEDDDNPNSLRDEAILKLDCLVRDNRYLNSFIRSRINRELGLLQDSAEKVGFVPLKNYVANSISPSTEDQIIVEISAGWSEIKPGEPGRIFADKSVVHFVEYLILQY